MRVIKYMGCNIDDEEKPHISSVQCTNDELMTECFLPQFVYASSTVNSVHERKAKMEIYHKAI